MEKTVGFFCLKTLDKKLFSDLWYVLDMEVSTIPHLSLFRLYSSHNTKMYFSHLCEDTPRWP